MIVAVWTAEWMEGARRRRFVEMRVLMMSEDLCEEVEVDCESRNEGRCARSWVSASGRGSKTVTRVSGRRRCMASIDRPIVPAPRRAMWCGYSDIVSGGD